MRRITLALLALALCAPVLGCMAISAHQRGVCNKSVVVYNDELYVVDHNRCVAHKVKVTECDPADSTKVVIIESDS